MRTEKEHPMITAGMLIDWIEPLAEKKQNRRFKPKAIRWINILPPHENEWEGLFEPNVIAASNNPESLLALDPSMAAVLVCEDIEALPESFDRENLLIVQTASAEDAAELIEYYGAIGANYTNATIGGLEYSSTHYLTAGTTGTQQSSDGIRNVYVTCVDRNWSTGYYLMFTDPETNNVNMSNPHLVKLGADSFLLIWAAGEELQYVFLKGDGEAASSIYRAKGTLSDCKPEADNGAAVWYVTDGTKVIFYKVSADGALTSEVGHLHSYDADMHFEKSQVNVSMVDKEVKNPLSCNGDGEITYSSSDTSVAAVDASGKVTVKGYGSCTITADMKAGVHYAAKTVSYKLTV